MRSLRQTNVGYTYNADGQLAKVLDQNRHEIQFNWSKFGLDSKTTAASQLASATHGDKTENFLWDGLALIHRGETSYLNEPYVTGGNPILSSKGDVMFNDILGNTLGVKTEKLFRPVKMTAFGETEDKEAMFTGKPYINELGYAFLMRNYRPEQGKWNSQDPIGIASNLPVPGKPYQPSSTDTELGYPDGWNNLAYVNNGATSAIDLFGAETITLVLSYGTWSTWSSWYEIGRSSDSTNPWIYWQRDRSRTNIVQDYDVDISYNTDNNGLMWANIGAGTGVSALALAAGISGPLGWVVFAAVAINQVFYQLYLPPGSPTNYVWTPKGNPYCKLEVETERTRSYVKPE